MKNKEEAIITAFVAHLAARDNPGLRVERWPDREPATPEEERIDAIAGKFAIEHTRIHALDEKPMRDDWFMKAGGKLAAQLKGIASCRLHIGLPYRAVEKGQDWKAVQGAIKSWILERSSEFPNGKHLVKISGVPFEIAVTKSTEVPGIFFYRIIDEADDTLIDTVGLRIPAKARKLAPYGAWGKTRVLLLESDDIAMMNHIKAAEAMVANFPNGRPEGVDEIWYADTTLGVGQVRFYDLGELLGEEARQW